jgi:peptide/nickel transport system substrate-binding protein
VSLTLSAGVVASASTASKHSATSIESSHTLNLAFTEDTQPLDPDVYYAGQGLPLILGEYQGLVQYQQLPVKHTGSTAFQAPGSRPKIIPDLATSWTESPDGLTYTFNLKAGVVFHDGTSFTSEAVKVDFARRLAVNGGPAYQVAPVASVSTPSPLVAVVHLKDPVSAFMDYLASAYGPKMISPTALAKHAGKDFAQTWLTTHDAGTGPYTMTKAIVGQEYVLSYAKSFDGPKPWYTTIVVKVIPDISTQELELERGQLTMLLQGLSTSAITQFKANKSFHVDEVGTLETTSLWVNPHLGILKNQAVRVALTEAVDKADVMNIAYPGRSAVEDQIYPLGAFSGTAAKVSSIYDPAKLTALVKKSTASKSIVLGWEQPDPTDLQVAEVIQTELASTGLQVTVKGYTDTALYGFATNQAGAPNLIVETNWPDAAAPDTWARIMMSKGGGLNYFECSVPAGDTLLNKGLATTSQSVANADDAAAGKLYAASGCWTLIGSRGDTIVAPTWMQGIVHQVPVPITVVLADLHP